MLQATWAKSNFLLIILNINKNGIKMNELALAGVDSVDRALACEPKGYQFDSQSGNMPQLQARSSVGGAQEATKH